MFKGFMFNTVIIVIMIFISGVDTVYPYDYFNNSLSIIEEDKYNSMCPYGDAVIILKEDSNKKNILVDCINYDSKKKMWETITAPTIKDLINLRKIQKEYFSPNSIEIYTLNGQLTVDQIK